jgi:hypothetical protein
MNLIIKAKKMQQINYFFCFKLIFFCFLIDKFLTLLTMSLNPIISPIQLSQQLALKKHHIENNFWRLNSLFDEVLQKVMACVRSNISTFTPELTLSFSDLYVEARYEQTNILNDFHSDRPSKLTLTDQPPPVKNENDAQDFYNRAWGIYDKIQYVLFKSSSPLSIPQLTQRILDYENISHGSDEAKQISNNINSTLSAKFSDKAKQENNVLQRTKGRSGYYYSTKEQEGANVRPT